MVADAATAQVGGTEGQQGKLTVAEILQVAAGHYVQRYPSQAAPQVQSTLAKLSLCRTAALGDRHYRCGDCAHECVVYNSCGDRHCPTCSGAKRADWLDSSSQLILDGVDYYQVVFTLPSDLSRLALGNRRAIYDLLFASAWSALKQTISAEQGYDAAALMVLHTWNQKLDAHGHVHAVVPGGGPALDGSGWRVSQRADDPKSAGRYLVDADELRRVYRDAFLRGLDQLRDRGELKLEGDFGHLQADNAWKSFTNELRATNWVSYINPPPREDCSAAHVLKYLARYLTGGPISDSRIVSADQREVTFMARAGETAGGESKQIPITLPTVEFTRRWSLHVLPKGYTKTRRFGGWSNPRRDAYLEQCGKQLEAIDALLSPEGCEFGPFEDVGDELEGTCKSCPACGGEMILQGERAKPSWRDVMSSPSRPSWYLVPGGCENLPLRAVNV